MADAKPDDAAAAAPAPTGAEAGAPKRPAFALKLAAGKKAPPALAATVEEPDRFGAAAMPPVKPIVADKAPVVRGLFASLKPKTGVAAPAAAAAVPKPAAKPKAAPAAAPAAAAPAAAAAPPVPSLAEMMEEQEAPVAAAAPAFEGDLGEMAKLIWTEEHKNLYNTAVPAAYVPETRRGFSDFIKTTYATFRLPEGAIGVAEGEKYYPYQKFVRDYLRKESPYRGVLVYHGLGSGKTCTSIATAEALYATDKKRIIVMTPASLRKNFQSEVSFCGFRHFQYNNYWVPLDPADETTTLFASQILNLSAADITKARAIWVPDFRRPQSESNYSTLPAEQRDEIRKQIQRQLEYYPTTNPKGRMQFINYNGVNNYNLMKMACMRNKDGSGPFDNAVIVIDEVHNLIRMMQASIEPYIRASMEAQGIAKEAVDAKKAAYKGKRRVVPVEPITHESWIPSKCPPPEAFEYKRVIDGDGKVKLIKPTIPKVYMRAYILFRLLASAKNVKIVALSGTPIINFPEEIGILANILHGFTTVVQGKVAQSGEGAKRIIEATALAHPFVDFVEARKDASAAGAGTYTVTLSLLPEGIRKISNDRGVQRIPPEEPLQTVPEIVESIKAKLAEAGVGFEGGSVQVRSEELLPMFNDEFRAAFLEGEMGERLRKDRVSVLITRLTGLISFYKGSNQELMPRIKTDEIVRVPFSLYAQQAYSIRRGEEIKKEETAGKTKTGGKDITEIWKKIYGMTDSKAASNYKTASRQACNFAFPPNVARPIPRNQAEEKKEADEGRIEDAADIFIEGGTQEEAEQALNAGAAGPAEGAAEAAPALVEEGSPEDLDRDDAEEAMAEDAAILGALQAEEAGGAAATQGGGEEDAEAEEETEGGEEAEDEAIPFEDDEADEADEEEPMSGGMDPAPAAPAAPKKTIALIREEKRLKDFLAARAAGEGPPLEECGDGKAKPGEDYIKDTCVRARECLRTRAKKHLLLSNEEDGLKMISPKMAAMMERINAAPGPSLVYSSFLALEGIGIFTAVMDVNGFAPIRIIERPLPGGAYGLDFDDESKASIMKGPGPNRYMLFTGGEKGELRRMYLNMFNGKFDQLPASLSDILKIYGFTDNKVGQFCRVFCITSAGAEGLSLRNVRAVHIMEPYWNYVRMRQVKGRAVRIGSHLDLPEADRDVSIYTYMSVFSDQAQSKSAGDYRIDADIIQNDQVSDLEFLKELGIPLRPGQKSYVLTTDELLYSIMERKRKTFDIMESLLKAAAVDCELNFKQNKDDSFVCLPLKGRVGDFLYHPLLERDLAEAGRFKVSFMDTLEQKVAAKTTIRTLAQPEETAAEAEAAAAAAARAAAVQAPPRPATMNNARMVATERLKAHVVSFYEDNGREVDEEKIARAVEKYKGGIWDALRAMAEKRGFDMEKIAKHEAEWKAGAAAEGPVVLQREADMFAPEAAVLPAEAEAAPFKPIVAAASGATAALPAVPPPAATTAEALPAPPAAPPAAPKVKILRLGAKKLTYRAVAVIGPDGQPTRYDLFEKETGVLAGTATVDAKGDPKPPVTAVGDYKF